MVDAKHHRDVDLPAGQLAEVLTNHVQDDWEGDSEGHSHGPAILASKSILGMHLLGEEVVNDPSEHHTLQEVRRGVRLAKDRREERDYGEALGDALAWQVEHTKGEGDSG